jgi:hypothetical protein
MRAGAHNAPERFKRSPTFQGMGVSQMRIRIFSTPPMRLHLQRSVANISVENGNFAVR